MRPKKQAVDSKRRIPKQERARDTIEVIFEATTRILEREGRAALNTNYIAEKAGISVATLYQYFPNKGAILIEMARREIAKSSAAVLRAIEKGSSDPMADPARLAIRALIGEFQRRRKARYLTLQALVMEGLGHELETNRDRVAIEIAARTDRILPGRTTPLSAVTVFILTRAVDGVLAAAASEGSTYLGTQEFEDELVALVHGFLLRQ